MKKRALFALLSLSALGLAACETEPGLNFAFQGIALQQAPTAPTPDSLTNDSPGILIISRNTVTPCFNDGLTAKGGRNGNQLTVTVTRVAASPCTNETDRHFRYRAIYGNLRTGTYQVRILENITGTAQVVKDTSLLVD